MKYRFTHLAPASLCCMALSAQAGEGFLVRYNLAGSLGGEMFAPPEQAGLGVGLAVTRVSIDKITGGDGQALRTITPGGTVNLGNAAINPTYAANEVQADASGAFTIYNVGVGYVSNDRFQGGRLAWALNLPYGVKDQRVGARTTVPALNWPNAAVPDASTKAGVQQQFASNYLAQVNGAAAAQSGEVSGLGDVEIQGGWLMATGQWRVLAGASIVLPTGRYDSSEGPDIGQGNFYTFRPAVQVAWLPHPDWSVAGKVTMGINTRNQDNDLRSGNWVGLEAALAYMTPAGPIGIHSVHVQQTQADSGNPYGDAPFRSDNIGVFLTTKWAWANAVVTAQTMKTVNSRYARHGTFNQIRVIKLF